MRLTAWIVLSSLLGLGIYLQVRVRTRDAAEPDTPTPVEAPIESPPVRALRVAVESGTSAGLEPLVEAVGDLRSLEALPVLDELVRRTRDRELLLQIARALEKIGGDDGVLLLYRIGKSGAKASGEENGLAREVAVRLSRVADRDATAGLLEIIEAESGAGLFAAAATRALGRSGQRVHVPRLIRLSSPGGGLEVRLAAVQALGSIADPLALPDLIALLADPEARIRRQTIRALGLIRSADTLAALEEFLRREPAELEAELAREALARQRGESRRPW